LFSFVRGREGLIHSGKALLREKLLDLFLEENGESSGNHDPTNKKATGRNCRAVARGACDDSELPSPARKNSRAGK
jgi:hypothetical protein